MDTVQLDFLLENFFYNTVDIFSLKDIQKYLAENKFKINDKILYHYIIDNPNVIPLRDSKFVTRAGIFTGGFFSFKPTKMEIENKIIIVGHRFMPFMNPEVMPHDFQINFLGSKIATKEMSFSSHKITPFYELFGAEYIPHYITNDPANRDLDFSAIEYGLPSTINLTVIDCSAIFDFFNFKYGDRIACLVSDWEKSVVEISPMQIKKDNVFEDTKDDKKRRKWFENAEKGLLNVFDSCGPCSSIDRQLMWLFTIYQHKLFINECGSIEELLKKSKVVDIVPYGVETRLWRKNEEIPLLDPFNEPPSSTNEIDDMFYEGAEVINDYILNSFILDALYRKDENIDALYKKIIDIFAITSDKDQRKFLLHLKKNHAIILKEYNWFIDNYVGQFRTCALDLYIKLFELKNDLKSIGERLDTLPSQPMVIYIQLVEHVSRLLVAFQRPELISDEEIVAISSSLEGMWFSYEETADILTSEIKNRQKEMFSVIKMED